MEIGFGNIQIWNPVKVLYGRGMLWKLAELTKLNRPLIICDPVFPKLEFFEDFQRLFPHGLVSSDVEPNPSVEAVNRLAMTYRHDDVDGVVAIGGGSALDTAKAVSALLETEDRLEEYLLGHRVFTKRKPLFLVPTTAGTGSEVTNVGVYTLSGVKRPMTSDVFWADAAIVDPELTYTMPPRLTATTGLDALTHAVESYWAKSSQPYTEGLALSSLKLILENLVPSIDGDKNARDKMSLAATIAGMAFSQTRTTAAHAISFPLTSFYGIEHGLAVALTLPKLVLWTYKHVKEKMDALLGYRIWWL